MVTESICKRGLFKVHAAGWHTGERLVGVRADTWGGETKEVVLHAYGLKEGAIITNPSSLPTSSTGAR